MLIDTQSCFRWPSPCSACASPCTCTCSACQPSRTCPRPCHQPSPPPPSTLSPSTFLPTVSPLHYLQHPAHLPILPTSPRLLPAATFSSKRASPAPQNSLQTEASHAQTQQQQQQLPAAPPQQQQQQFPAAATPVFRPSSARGH